VFEGTIFRLEFFFQKKKQKALVLYSKLVCVDNTKLLSTD
jgi:hypothetical protein